MNQQLARGHSVKTTCPYCGVGCGLQITADDNGGVKVYGDASHPSNRGRLCSKGAALGETLSLDNRLLEPAISGRNCTWDEALDAVASGFGDIIEKHGPDSVAFYLSGQLLTEDYYLANKLMKGFIGSANVDTNSRLCMSSSVVGHKRAFGADSVPCSYDDLEYADLVILVGSNTAWCHPVLYQRIRKARKNRPDMKIVVIDPRRTETAEIADFHLAIKPGADLLLFNALLAYLADSDQLNADYIEAYTEGFDDAIAQARSEMGSLARVAEKCGLSPGETGAFFELFAGIENTVTVYSQGVNQWSYGSDKVNAIINCHLATGRIGKPGQGPFSFTGQPNAMGGREVGGLANQLACHLDFSEKSVARVAEFWQSSHVADKPGLMAVDLFDAIERGEIKAIWIMATNPVVSVPQSAKIRRALEQCELVVVSDCVQNNDTLAVADIVLPASAWGEKDGMVTNSERRISRQRAFMAAPGMTKPDWRIISEVAGRMGFEEAFGFESALDVWNEYAAMCSAIHAETGDLDLSGLCQLSDDSYENFLPVQWPVNSAGQSRQRLFSDGRYYHPDGKARFIAVDHDQFRPLTRQARPLVLNTGRIRDQWHTMTRTGKTARLVNHLDEPFVQVHPQDAATYGLKDGGFAKVASSDGEMLIKVDVSEQQLEGCVFIPMHWNHTFSSTGPVDALIPDLRDPYSGQPQFKAGAVSIEPWQTAWQGYFLSRSEFHNLDFDYWTRARSVHSWRYKLASASDTADYLAWFREQGHTEGDWLEFQDPATGDYRAALIHNDRLECCFFASKSASLPEYAWLDSLFDAEILAVQERARLLSGQPGTGQGDTGKMVCACFSVSQSRIEKAVREEGLDTVEEIGQLTSAGTNCGSCVPEIEHILKSAR